MKNDLTTDKLANGAGQLSLGEVLIRQEKNAQEQ